MRQRARVKDAEGTEATVEVTRSSMCDGCEKSGGCGGHCAITGIVDTGRPMTAKALNEIGAVPGDLVEVETDSGTVLGSAALVFLAPLAVCAVFYALGSRLFGGEGPGLIAAAVGFVLSFALIGLFDRKLKKEAPRIRIVSVIGDPANQSD